MHVQACIRRLLVRSRKERLIQRREVQRRKKTHQAKMKNESFTIAGQDALHELHHHSDEAIDAAIFHMPAVKRGPVIKYCASMCRRLLESLEGVSRIAKAPNEGAANDEMCLLLCELLHASQCDIYPVETTDGQEFLKINYRVFVPVRYHGLLYRGDWSQESEKGGRPVSYPHLELSEHAKQQGVTTPDAQAKRPEPGQQGASNQQGAPPAVDSRVGVLEWYEPRSGFRELVVKAAEMDRVQATMKERNFKTARVGYRLKEYGHAMVIPVWSQPTHASVRNRPGHVQDDEEEDAPPVLSALIQVIRPPGDNPFDADDEYLASVLAPHYGHALHRARVLARKESQLGKLVKLHQWGAGTGKLESPDDVVNLASSLFAADDVALYAMISRAKEDGRGGRGRQNRDEDDGRNGILQPVKRGTATPLDSVNGLETLIESGQSLALSQGLSGTKGYDSLLGLLRRPFAASARSMLCIPAFVHKQSLSMAPPGENEKAVVPCLLQYANARGRPFGRSDLLVAQTFTDVLGRLAAYRAMKSNMTQLEERFKIGDMRRNALMESARMLANRMEMEELFAAVMIHAKDLMEVDRSTLFMVDKAKKSMYTIVADGAAPITIPVDKGLAGAAYVTGKVVNIADAYYDERFNREIDMKSGYRTKSVLCYPIHNSRDEVIAVIQLINKLTGMYFNTADEELIAAFCAQLAVSIENCLAIDEMNRSQKIAAEQKQRMHNFLDVVGEVVRLPATEVCVSAQKAAIKCTASLGAALFICPDNAPEMISASTKDVDAFDKEDGKKDASQATNALGMAMPVAKLEEDVELVQLVPTLMEGCWPQVMQFAKSVMISKTTLEDEVDINDNGLPEALRFDTKPKMVRCMATPLSISNGEDDDTSPNSKALGVLAVWGGTSYSPADQQVLRTLAILASHLLITTDGARQKDVALATQRENLRIINQQRDSLFAFAQQLGTPEPQALHAVAHKLSASLNCAACSLWLIETDARRAMQKIVAQLPPGCKGLRVVDDKAAKEKERKEKAAAEAEAKKKDGGVEDKEGDEEEEKEEDTGPSVQIHTDPDGITRVDVPLVGQGILGQVVTTAKGQRVKDAHIHHAYAPEIDEATCALKEDQTALLLCPLIDHTGRVLGVLQASGKRFPRVSASEEQAAIWERDVLETPSFTQGDEHFLTVIADRMASQLQLLTLTDQTASEVVDQQTIAAELQAQAEALQKTLLDGRRSMHSAHRKGGYHGGHHGSSASRASSRSNRSEDSFSVDEPAYGVSQSHASIAASLHGEERSGGRPRDPSKKGRASDSRLREDELVDPLEAMAAKSGSKGMGRSATQPVLARGSGPKAAGMLAGAGKNLDTPDAVWEDLCRTLREL